jgi:hypothetical protein
MKKIQNASSQGKQFQAHCHYCGSTVGEISQRTEELTNAMYDCEKCNDNYCDQCSYENDIDGQVKQFCLRCESEIKKIE